MDIHRLLSPSESRSGRDSASASPAATPAASPRKQRAPRPSGSKRSASGLSHEITRSPDRDPPSFPSQGMSPPAAPSAMQQLSAVDALPRFRPLEQSAQARPGDLKSHDQSQRYSRSLQHRPSVAPSSPSRMASTPQMDTLAGEYRALTQFRLPTPRTRNTRPCRAASGAALHYTG